MEKLIVVTPSTAPLNYDQNKKTCIACNSKNTQTIKMMCLSGATSGTSTAVGVTTSLDVGAAAISSNSQTHLAALYNPGSKPVTGEGCLGMFLWFVFLLISMVSIMSIPSVNRSTGVLSTATLLGLICIFCMLYLYSGKIKRSLNSKVEAWEQKNKLYETGWICHKCGRTWTP